MYDVEVDVLSEVLLFKSNSLRVINSWLCHNSAAVYYYWYYLSNVNILSCLVLFCCIHPFNANKQGYL